MMMREQRQNEDTARSGRVSPCHGFAHSLFLADRQLREHRYLATLEHGSLSLNSLANSLGNLGTHKKTYNWTT
jgi:hypothetical protein